MDTPLGYKDLTSSDQFPSYTQANHDMKGLHQLQEIEIPDLHYLATCLVDFKGSRMICQSIIPGILNNSDLSSLAEYGTVDDKKTIVANEQFHEKMLKVVEALHIKVNKVVDPSNGKSVEIAGSVEIKGIKGADRRSYVVDLQGLVPRDANYVGEDIHTCLVRPELISLFQRSKNMEYATDRIKDFSKKLDDERIANEPKPEEGKELTDDQKRAMQMRRQEDNMRKLKEVERLIGEAPKFAYNANVFKSNCQLDLTPAQVTEEESNVRQLATYINEKAIPNLVQDLKQQEGCPIDSQSLQDFIHKRGINMRYLGKVLAEIDEHPKGADNMSIHLLQMLGDYKHVKILLEREIFVRSAKHVVNRVIKEERGESDLHLASVVAHCLNCILAPTPFLQAMNAGKIRPIDDAVQNSFQFFPEESIPSPRKGSMSSPSPSKKAVKEQAPKVSDFEPKAAGNPEQLTKKQLKKQKQKQKAAATGTIATPEEVQSEATRSVSEMDEILFKSNELMVSQTEEFNVEDLFSQPVLSNGLHRLMPPTFFSLTPREVYDQIKEIAKVKFGHELPAEQKKLGCLQKVNYKTALLRDLCKVIGIQIVFDQQKKLILGNKIKPIVNSINEQLQHEMAQSLINKKKKAA